MSEDLKVEFVKWLENGNAKKITPAFCIENLLAVSKYAISRSIAKQNFFEMKETKVFNLVRNALLKNKIFRKSDGNAYKTFERTGKLYADFLKQHLVKANIENAETAPQELTVNKYDNSSFENRRTIVEAIAIVLQETAPLTSSDICKTITARGLYIFGAKSPSGVVSTELMRHSVNQETYSIASKNKIFRIVGESDGNKLFALDNNKTVEDAKRRVGLLSETKEKIIFDWNQSISNSFSTWLLNQGKSAATSRQYASNIKSIISRYKGEFETAKKEESLQLGAKKFLEVLEINQQFKENECHPSQHNRFTAALRAFCEFCGTTSLLFPTVKDELKQCKVASEGVVDWNASVSYMKTKPRQMVFRDTETYPRSWNYLFVDVVNFLIELFPNTNIDNYKYANTNKQLILDEFSGFNPHKQLSNGQYLDTNFSADNIVKIIKDIFVYYSLDIRELRVTIARGGSLLRNYEEDNIENTRHQESTEEEKQIIEVFKNNFKSGMRLGFIDIKKLSNAYHETYCKEIPLSENDLRSLVTGIAIKVDGERYIHIQNLISQSVLDEIILFIDSQFNAGRNRVWIEAIIDIFGYRLPNTVNEELLMVIIEKASNGKYKTNKNKKRENKFIYFRSQDLSQPMDEEVKHSILAVLQRENVPMTAAEINKQLPCYPASRIRQIISSGSSNEIIWLTDEKAVHIDYVYIDEVEFETVKEILKNTIERDRYVQISDLVKRIQEQCPSIIENNEYVGVNGVLKAIQFRVKDLHDRKAIRYYVGSTYINLPDVFTNKEGK